MLNTISQFNYWVFMFPGAGQQEKPNDSTRTEIIKITYSNLLNTLIVTF